MSKEIFFKALDAIQQIERNLKASTFAAIHGANVMTNLMDYELDMAMDIYRTFTPPEEDHNSMAARNLYYIWYVEYTKTHSNQKSNTR